MIDIIKNMNILARDGRVTDYVMPARILRTRGQVENAEAVLRGKAKSLQVCTEEPDCLVMTACAEEQAEILLDFGVEFAGGVRILIERCGGNPKMRLTFGESAGEAVSEIGEKNAVNDHAARQMTIEPACFSDQVYGQTGFRFLRVELLKGNAAVRISAIWGAFTYRDIPYRGRFSCNDELINRIYDIGAYTCHLNMQGMLWDGIKRDRLVWIGDMHPEMLTIRTVFGEDRCIEEGLDYAVQTSPLPGYANNMVTYSMWWLIILRDWYTNNMNGAYIRKRRKYIRDLSNQLCGLATDDGGDLLAGHEHGYFLDWPSYGKPGARAGVRALFSIALRAAAELNELNGEISTAGLCVARASALDRLAGPVPADKQAVALMLLAGQASPEPAVARLLEGGAKGMSTFMSYYILTALAGHGHIGQALDLLREYYGGMLSAGATTFWEDFDIAWLRDGARIDRVPEPGEYDIHGDNGMHCYVGYRHSLCHGWSSAPVAFLAEQVLGIRVLEPGCRLVSIKPNLGNLQWAKGVYPTPHGDISVSHTRREDGTVDSECMLPDGIIAANL